MEKHYFLCYKVCLIQGDNKITFICHVDVLPRLTEIFLNEHNTFDSIAILERVMIPFEINPPKM